MPVARTTWLDPRGPDALLATLCRPEVASAWDLPANMHDLPGAIARRLRAWVEGRPDVVAIVEGVLAGSDVSEEPLFDELIDRAIAWRHGLDPRLTWQLLSACGPQLSFSPPLLPVLLGRAGDDDLARVAAAAGLDATDAFDARDRLYRLLRNADGVRVLLARLPEGALAVLAWLAGRHGRPVPEDPSLAPFRRCGLLLGYGDGAWTMPVETAHAVHAVAASALADEARRALAHAAGQAPLGLPLGAREASCDQIALSVLLGPLDPCRRAADAMFAMDPAIVKLGRLDGVLGHLRVRGMAATEVARARALADGVADQLDRFELRVAEGLQTLPPGRALAVVDLARFCCATAASLAAEHAGLREPLAATGDPLCWRGCGELWARPPVDEAEAYVGRLTAFLALAGLARSDGDRLVLDVDGLAVALARLRGGLPGSNLLGCS